MKTLISTLFALMAMSLPAAADAYIDADGRYVETPSFYAAEPAERTTLVGPRVYGWTSLPPDDCGTFKYWNGEDCVDARFEPPRSDVD